MAEDVEKVNPDLAVRDKEGKPYSVRYDQVNAMLLNEFLKEHKAFIEEQRILQETGSENRCIEVNRSSATARNGTSHGAAQRAGQANSESEHSGAHE